MYNNLTNTFWLCGLVVDGGVLSVQLLGVYITYLLHNVHLCSTPVLCILNILLDRCSSLLCTRVLLSSGHPGDFADCNTAGCALPLICNRSSAI